MKRLAALWRLLATKTRLSAYVEASDVETIERRSQAEGITFFTVTLPALYKALDAATRGSTFVMPEGFVRAEGCNYPLLLAKAWSLIFDKDGTLLPTREVNVGAVACIRQLSAMFYKLELQYTKDQTDKVLQRFIRTEEDLKGLALFQLPTRQLLNRARKTVHRLLSGVNPHDIRPRHGSGSSSCRVIPWERYESFRFIPRLNREFPYTQYFFYNMTHLCDNVSQLLNSVVADPYARCVFVPKDSRGPRLISCEPREFMYIQQGLMTLMYKKVEERKAIAGQIGFTDQTRNQRLAKQGSIDGLSASLDLTEASDKVSLELVDYLFPDNWVSALRACRSKGTELPDGTLMPLRKFAPMGSACCFPVEAICFWSIALAAMPLGDDYYNRLFRDHLRADDAVLSVFGDDIIVPTRFVERVIQALELVGLEVNRDKSYWSGPFRESCGGDYFLGVDVAPVRVRTLPDSDDNAAKFRMASTFNNMLDKYGTKYNESLFHDLFEEWYGPVPKSSRFATRETDDKGLPWVMTPQGVIQGGVGSPYSVQAFNGLALKSEYTDVPNTFRSRWNKRLQRREYRIPIRCPIDFDVNIDRWGQVLRRELQELSAERPAALCALPKRISYKYGWSTL